MRKTVVASLMSCTLLSAVVPARAAPTAEKPAAAAKSPELREIEIVVEQGSYKPAEITVKAGERVRLKVIRKEYSGCTRELVIPALDVRRELPPNKPVTIDLPPLAAGQYEYRCGMNMVRGAITVQAS